MIPLPTVNSIYEVPLILEEAGLGDYIVERLELGGHAPDLGELAADWWSGSPRPSRR